MVWFTRLETHTCFLLLMRSLLSMSALLSFAIYSSNSNVLPSCSCHSNFTLPSYREMLKVTGSQVTNKKPLSINVKRRTSPMSCLKHCGCVMYPWPSLGHRTLVWLLETCPISCCQLKYPYKQSSPGSYMNNPSCPWPRFRVHLSQPPEWVVQWTSIKVQFLSCMK